MSLCNHGRATPGKLRGLTAVALSITLTPRGARPLPPEPHHISAGRSLVDKHQPRGIKHALLADPTSARAGHIGSLPFRGLQAFFERDAVSIEKPPERTAAGSKSAACAVP